LWGGGGGGGAGRFGLASFSALEGKKILPLNEEERMDFIFLDSYFGLPSNNRPACTKLQTKAHFTLGVRAKKSLWPTLSIFVLQTGPKLLINARTF